MVFLRCCPLRVLSACKRELEIVTIKGKKKAVRKKLPPRAEPDRDAPVPSWVNEKRIQGVLKIIDMTRSPPPFIKLSDEEEEAYKLALKEYNNAKRVDFERERGYLARLRKSKLLACAALPPSLRKESLQTDHSELPGELSYESLYGKQQELYPEEREQYKIADKLWYAVWHTQ
eukprot:GILK01011340.1.p1 GENE.GILK01011340.1~~GILK01011340.1.p1  ORF type:complete len:174 (-),score=31.92 GILK01011340.1:49-570(-)